MDNITGSVICMYACILSAYIWNLPGTRRHGRTGMRCAKVGYGPVKHVEVIKELKGYNKKRDVKYEWTTASLQFTLLTIKG